MTPEKIELGRKLFFDRRLSHNDTFSCAMCHVPRQGFTVNEMATAVGIEGLTVKRNAPTLLNVAYAPTLFHDARERRLELQIWSPLLAHNEMGNPSIGYLLDKIEGLDDYRGPFCSSAPQGFKGQIRQVYRHPELRPVEPRMRVGWRRNSRLGRKQVERLQRMRHSARPL